MTTQSSDLVCFIDLLSTKESAKISADDFREAIEEFASTLGTGMINLDATARLSIFSDCAFIQAPANQKSIFFFQKIRERLFDSGYYFKCAIGVGLLGEGYNPLMLMPEASREKIKDRVSISVFTEESVNCYIAHEAFKGIGYTIHKDAKKMLRDFLVKSVYFPSQSNDVYQEFYDLKFSETEIGKTIEDEASFRKKIRSFKNNNDRDIISIIPSYAIFNKFLHAFAKANTKDKSYGRYYIPTMISFIRSSDFSQMEFDDHHVCFNFPYIFFLLILDQKFYKQFQSVPRIEILYYCLIDETVRQNPDIDENFWVHVGHFFSNKKRLLQKLGKAPSWVISSSTKDKLLDHTTENITSPVSYKGIKSRADQFNQEEN